MRCSCPKCAVKIEVDVSTVTENGTYTPCPECKSRIWINQESTVMRAQKKEGKIYCAKCGNELDHLIVCRGCGFKFPDYFLVQVSKPVRRKAGKSDRSMHFALQPVSQTYATPTKSASAVRKPLVAVVGLLIVAALVTAGTAVYHKMSLEKQYRQYFILVLSGAKAGTDIGLADCARISAEWKAKMDAGQNYVPSVSPQVALRLRKIKDRAEQNRQKLNNPPEKYTAANEKLANLYGVYANIYASALTPSGSFASFTDSARKAEENFKMASQALKDNLTPDLAEDINAAKTRDREMRDF